MGNDRAIVRAEALAARQHGAISRRQVLSLLLSDKVIRRMVRSGRWRIGERGVYVVAGAPRTFEQAVMVAVLGECEGAAASHLAAGVLHGLVTTQPARIDVTVPGQQHDGRRPGKLVHRAESLGDHDVRRVSGIRVTCPERTLVDLASVLEQGRLEHALDTALNRGLTSIPSLERYIRERKLTRLKGMGRLRRLIADRKRGVPGSGLERALRRVLREHRLPEPERQLRTGGGRLDFSYPAYNIFIEVDGDWAHGTAAALRSDLRRQNALVLERWDVPLRYTESCIYEDAERVCREIETALRARGWTPDRRPRRHRPGDR